MNRLIDAFEGLFTAAAICGGELAETAKFTLENVNWRGKLSKPEPLNHPIWIGIWKRPALTRDSTAQAPIELLKPCWR